MLIVALVCITAVGVAAIAQAHWVPTFSGWAYHSVRCTVGLDKAKNAKAVTECLVTTAAIESLCVNNGGNLQPQGVSHSPVVLQAETTGGSSDVVKVKDFALVNVTVGTPDGKPNDPPLNSSFCANNTWTNVANLIRSFQSQINTYKCLDDLCETKQLVSTVETVAPCTLPAQFSLSGYDIGANPFDTADDHCPNCPPQGTEYVCPDVVSAHVD
jgi:hypothetical protein